jgi:hypothetical protein
MNGFMFFSLSALSLEDHLGLVTSPQSPLSAGYITLRAYRRSLPPRLTTFTVGGIDQLFPPELPVQYSR